jgi:uncharacterized protein (TIGR03435 family)
MDDVDQQAIRRVSGVSERLLLRGSSKIAALLLVASVTAAAQDGAPSAGATGGTKLPAWDVVSVRPVAPNSCTGDAGMRGATDGIRIFCVPLLFAVEQAYKIGEPNRILGAPDWAKNDIYDIDAKVAAEDVEAFGKLNEGDVSRMLQPLLAQRFQLKTHVEQREMPVYNLVVIKGGSKLKDATPEDASKGGRMVTNGRGKIDAANATLTGLPGFLTNEVGRPIVDKTGLTGKYDFTLDYVPAARAATDETGGPSVFTALEEQLGLKLEPAKEPMDVLVIDQIERPVEN